ncbi:MAG: hypothetical protein HZB51_02230 [Chloroflexi bacterium]|nr:hypothetical protein [Chloroflexota bacterium]
MQAFVTFVRSYAVWIYILFILGIFFGVKMLVDAQRLSRATLFSLDQERATQRTYSAIILMAVFLVGMFVVTGIVVLLAPLAPTQDPAILRGPTSTIAAFIFPTTTRTPTLTATALPPTETPFYTATPILATQTRPPIKATNAPVAAVATATSVYKLPAPIIVGPVPNGVVVTGEDRARNDLKFQWTWYCTLCKLGPDDRFVVTVSFIDRVTGGTRFIGGGTQGNFLTMADLIRGAGTEVWHQAKEDAFQWNVQVKRGDQPLTAPSDTWRFVWH